MEIFASSAYLWMDFTISRRRSSVSGGKMRRISRPSLCGLMPISEAWIAFSIILTAEASHGWMVRIWGSGTATVAIWLMGVGAP